MTNAVREKRRMTIDDLKKQIDTTLSTTEVSFRLGEVRVLCILFVLLLAPTGSCPGAVLRLRFGDVKVSLVRDPDGGPHLIVPRFTLDFTKTYLGPKAAYVLCGSIRDLEPC